MTTTVAGSTTPAASNASAASINQHVVDAILAYCKFGYPQRHALMVNGKWGSGKTHLLADVAEALIDRRLSGDRAKPLYITLYGVKPNFPTSLENIVTEQGNSRPLEF